MKIPVIAVVGPTASGKTALGVELAKQYDGEVVSADSMQIYKQLKIATARPSDDEMNGIAHHMIGFLDVDKKYSAALYCEQASKCISDIFSRNKLPILVGGTGLYVDSLLSGIDFSVQDEDEDLRRSLNDEYDNFGGEYMLKKLKAVDEPAAEITHANNKKRLIRFLELYMLTGKTMNERAAESKKNESDFEPLYICITCRDRQKLYDRINSRVDKMMEDGLLDEVKRYYEYGNVATSSQAIGCKELKPYFDGECDLTECIENLKKATRRYANRQLTWFLRNDKIHLMFTDEMSKSDIIDECKRLINDFLKGFEQYENKCV